jgi:hypothetical protein
MSNLRQCEPEEVVTGLQVILNLDLIRPLFPDIDETTVRLLLERHAMHIAAHMVSAGVEAAVQLFNTKGGPA